MKKIIVGIKILLLLGMLLVVGHDYVVDQQGVIPKNKAELCVQVFDEPSKHYSSVEHHIFHIPFVLQEESSPHHSDTLSRKINSSRKLHPKELSNPLFNPPKHA